MEGTLGLVLLGVDPTLVQVCATAVRARGGCAVPVADADAALEAVRGASGPVALLVGWDTPGLDAPAVCQRVRALPGGDGVTLLVAAAAVGSSAPAPLAAALAAGATDCLALPADLARLEARLDAALAAGRTDAAAALPDRCVFESSVLGVAVWQLDGRIVAANDTFLTMVQATRDELRWGQLTLPGVTAPEFRGREGACVAELVKGAGHGLVETAFLRRDGGRVPALVGCARFARRRDLGVVYVLDVSGRRWGEAAVRESEERLQLVTRATTDAVWDWDLRTNQISWNLNFETLFGYPNANLGTTLAWWEEKVHPEDLARVVAGLRSAIEGDGQHWTDEYRFRRADSSWAHVFDRGFVLRDATGRATRIIGAMVDITERKMMQARLAQADRLASVGTLAAGVAHEINNPLAYVLTNLGYALAALVRVGEDVPPWAAGDPAAVALREATRALGEACHGAERVRQIVRDLRVLSRPDEPSAGPVAVAALLEASINIAEPAVRGRARLVREFAPVPLVVGSDARLGQVFLNLLVNATQAIPEGAPERHTIRVATRLHPSGRVAVEVADTGVGIAPEALEHIFDPFFTTKAVGEGTGLGLSICHSIVTGLGGEIEVESEPGRGALFRVLLPVARPAAAAAAPARPSAAPARGARVLMVDDEPMMFNAVRRALDRLLADEPFDVILCDLMMPQMTGMDLYDTLARVAPEQTARMVFLTGGAFTPRAREFLERVPNARLEKPFDLDALLAVVHARLQR